MIFCVLLYPLLGWLFRSYTVLRWRRFSLTLLFQRLFITALVTLMVVAFARWLVNPADDVWLVYRSVQLVWLSALTLWSFLIRIALRRGLLSPDAPRLLLLASDQACLILSRLGRELPCLSLLFLYPPTPWRTY